jgi:hypothetical protein
MLACVSSAGRGSASRRLAACALCLAVVMALAGFVAPRAMSAGLGGSGALSELTQGQPETTASTPKTATGTTSTETTNSDSNSRLLLVLGVGAAVVLLGGIAFVIVRDARRVAPVGDGDSLERGSARDSAARLRRRRAKAKAARQQRKRNR